MAREALAEAAAEYHSKDFEWEELREEVERDPSLRYHLSPFQQLPSPPPVSSLISSSADSIAWSSFHSCHSTGKFFKERRYLLKEFPELVTCTDYIKILEVGCGNGSTVLPILRSKKNAVVYACDCSSEALERVRDNIKGANIDCTGERFVPFCCDISIDKFPQWLICDACHGSRKDHSTTSEIIGMKESESESSSLYDLSCIELEMGRCCIRGVDFLTLIFTLSAVPLKRMSTAVKECFSVLKPGGLLFFRDYGLYDMTMLRFEPGKRVGFREYMRHDGTRSYFFSLDVARELFISAGFIELELEYCCIKSVNRQKGKSLNRVWVHGKFQKPI